MSSRTTGGAAALTLDVRAVGGLAGLGERTIWRLVAQGQFPAPMKLGGRRLWHRAKLEEFLAAKHVEAQGEAA